MSKIFLLLMLLTSSCYSQKIGRGCDTLILDEHSQSVLNVHESTLQEYLIKRGENHSDISDRNSLRLMRTLICNNSEVLIFDTIQDKIIEINIEKGYENFDPNEFLMPEVEGVPSNSLLLYTDENVPFGFMPDDTIVKKIIILRVKVNGKELQIPVSAFEDLFFPNFCNTEISIKPIQIYTSPNEDKLFIYIFGENRESKNISYQSAFQYSYMAKLIIDLEEGYQSRIVLRGDKLCYYNWDNCFDFIGF